jgi:hypothetical protein
MIDYRKIIEQPGSMRFAKDTSLMQDIVSETAIAHAKGLAEMSKKQIGGTGTLFSDFVEDYPLPANGVYIFTYNAGVLSCTRNNASLGDIAVSNFITYRHFGFVFKMNSSLIDGLSFHVAVWDAKIYAGLTVTGTFSTISVSSGIIVVNGHVIEVNEQTLNYQTGSTKYLILNVVLSEVPYTDSPSVLGHYIASLSEYHPRSPKALKLSYTYSIADTPHTAAYTNTSFSVPIAKCSNSPVTEYVESIHNSLAFTSAFFRHLSPVLLTRLKSIANGLHVDMDDGNGVVRLLTEKEPSMPNIVETITFAIYPYSFVPKANIENTIRLREIELSNLSMLRTHITRLQDLKNLSFVVSTKEEMFPMMGDCLAVGAITQVDYDELKNNVPLSEFPDYIGGSSSGLILGKTNELSATQTSVSIYEKNIYDEAHVAADTEIIRGRLYIEWTEPALVDEEKIVGYKVKVIRVKTGFSATSQNLLDQNIRTPKDLIESQVYGQYINKAEPIFETDPIRKTVVNKEIVYVNDSQTTSYNCDVTPKEKVIVFISCVTELGIDGDWSKPFVIDVPNLEIDPITQKTFKEYLDGNAQIRTVVKDVESSMIKRDIDQKLFDIQIASAEMVTKTELAQKLGQ